MTGLAWDDSPVLILRIKNIKSVLFYAQALKAL